MLMSNLAAGPCIIVRTYLCRLVVVKTVLFRGGLRTRGHVR